MSADPQEKPQPTKTLNITSRVMDTKYVLTPIDGTNVLYYILSPPGYKRNRKKHRHACGWCAIAHAGDNPKYNPLSETPIVGRTKRTSLWKKYLIEYGGPIQKEVKKEEKEIKEKKLKTSNMFRRWFCKAEKTLEWSDEDEAAIQGDEKGADLGSVTLLEMEHMGHRKYEFTVDGRTYRWTGTRMHAGKFINALGLKGFAYHVKMIRVDDHKLIASFKKCYFGKEGKVGELNFYAQEPEAALNEFLIVQTGFCMIKSEKEKRDRVWEILEEIGENAGG